MANILTPLSLWGQFDDSLPTNAEIISATETDGVVIERVSFLGRNTDDGRVKIAAAFAYDSVSPALETVIVFSDSVDTIDEGVLKLFVSRGYSALMVDYRGKWKDCDFFTQYPECIGYANTRMCGRYKDFVDESADVTSWYEWVAVGIYACKYVRERTGGSGIAVVGMHDGGEIAWKVGAAVKLSCIIPVCAAGWKAYAGVSKYLNEEPQLDSERYRFIAGIDSQAYAPYVKCPVLMLCSTNDERFDYDRAYDTFSRINPEFSEQSAISYSVRCNSGIGEKSVNDMFMFLDKYLKKRQVFIPKPAEVTVEMDKKANLVARVNFDDRGIVEKCNVYLAEDNIVSYLREWVKCPFLEKISTHEQVFGLNVYEKTSTVYVLCYVTKRFYRMVENGGKKAERKIQKHADALPCNVCQHRRNGGLLHCFAQRKGHRRRIFSRFFKASVACNQGKGNKGALLRRRIIHLPYEHAKICASYGQYAFVRRVL